MAELMYRLGHSTPSMAMRYQHSRLDRDRDLGRRFPPVVLSEPKKRHAHQGQTRGEHLEELGVL